MGAAFIFEAFNEPGVHCILDASVECEGSGFAALPVLSRCKLLVCRIRVPVKNLSVALSRDAAHVCCSSAGILSFFSSLMSRLCNLGLKTADNG